MIDDLLAELTAPQNWSDATVKALLGRLLKKKAVKSIRTSGRSYYEPMIDRGDYVAAESQGFLDRLFGGQLAPFVSHFAERQPMTAEDIARLRAIIARFDEEQSGGKSG